MRNVALSAGVALALLATGALAGASPGTKAAQKTKARPQPAEDGYYVPHVTGPGGEKHPVMEIPGSVTIVSRKLMDDIQATSVGDALRFVPGVQVMGR